MRLSLLLSALLLVPTFLHAQGIQIFGGETFTEAIFAGDRTPSLVDGTDFGQVTAFEPAVFATFRIQNTSTDSALDIFGGISLQSDTGGFTVSSSPPSVVGAGQFVEFSIRMNSNSSEGEKTAIVSILSSASSLPYNFQIRGFVGTLPTPEITNVGVANDAFVLEIEAPASSSYSLYTSTDLVNWGDAPIRTGITSGIVRLNNFSNFAGNSPRRFFRLEEE